MLRTFFLAFFLFVSVYMNFEAARHAYPGEAAEQFFYRRAVPVILWAEDQARKFFDKEHLKDLFQRS